MPLFDAYVMVDWSAAAAPVTGRDSIWIGAFARTRHGIERLVLENPATRAEATRRLCGVVSRELLVSFHPPASVTLLPILLAWRSGGSSGGTSGRCWASCWTTVPTMPTTASTSAPS